MVDEVRRARLRLAGAGAAAAAVAVLVLVAGARGSAPAPPGDRGTPTVAGTPALSVPPPAAAATAPGPVPAAWAKPIIRDPQRFAAAFAAAVWTYDTGLPYERWSDAVAGWADPLGHPASPAVARSMLPPRSAYAALRAQAAAATATVTALSVPAEVTDLADRAPPGWHAYVVRGTQRVVTRTGRYEVARQAAIAVVCDPTCSLWAATPEVGA